MHLWKNEILTSATYEGEPNAECLTALPRTLRTTPLNSKRQCWEYLSYSVLSAGGARPETASPYLASHNHFY